MNRLFSTALLLAISLLGACQSAPGLRSAAVSPVGAEATESRVQPLLPTDFLLLGEQHDAPDHHRLERETVEALVQRKQLAALVIEMADEGLATTLLAPSADEAQVRQALNWKEEAWPWADYGPSVMAAVRAGVPVLGANLPRMHMRDAMSDVSLDAQLDAAAMEAQRRAVRDGHCGLLPESQIGPMTRIQVARDRSMAQTLVKARVPGRTVVMISGAAHATRLLGVPQHLPSEMSIRTVRLRAGDQADEPAGAYDAVWVTPGLPAKDYCAGLREAARRAG